jgi:hypothetical protein
MEGQLQVKTNSPAEMIKLAVEGKANLDQLKGLLDLQKDWEAKEAKKAFVKAMTAFKASAPVVTKDKDNKQYNSKYTSLSNLVNTVNPVLSQHGLSASWDIEQNGIIKVTCRITHELGHSETASASAPADTSGAKNAIQQIKSTITYLKSVTFESICGLASSEANLDDDGNGASGELIGEKEKGQILDFFAELGVKPDAFLKFMKVKSVEEIKMADFPKAIKSLEQALKQKGKK